MTWTEGLQAPVEITPVEGLFCLAVEDQELFQAFTGWSDALRYDANVNGKVRIEQTFYFPADRSVRSYVANFGRPLSALVISEVAGEPDLAIVMRNYRSSNPNDIWGIVQIMSKESALKLAEDTQTYDVILKFPEALIEKAPKGQPTKKQCSPSKSGQMKAKRKAAKKSTSNIPPIDETKASSICPDKDLATRFR